MKLSEFLKWVHSRREIIDSSDVILLNHMFIKDNLDVLNEDLLNDVLSSYLTLKCDIPNEKIQPCNKSWMDFYRELWCKGDLI